MIYCWVSPYPGSPGVRARHKANEQSPKLCRIAAFSELMPLDANIIIIIIIVEIIFAVLPAHRELPLHGASDEVLLACNGETLKAKLRCKDEHMYSIQRNRPLQPIHSARQRARCRKSLRLKLLHACIALDPMF